MSSQPHSTSSSRLEPNQLGVAGVVFLVLAAVAPLTGIIVVAALGIALGNGGGMVGSFILVMVVLLLFAVGYSQMSKQLVNAGGFYAYTVKGLGRPASLVAGLIALLGYNFFVAGAVGTSGFFVGIIMAQLTGVNLHWFLWALIFVVPAYLFSRRGIGFSAKVLGIALVLEVLILLVFDVAVLVQTGFSLEVFAPTAIFSGAVGVGLLFAANAFVGFEATGLFSEEARNPLKTIPRATFISIAFIGLFAAFTTWAIVSATGVAEAQRVAIEHTEAGDLVFWLSGQYLGEPLTIVMMLLLLVSMFAALMALHSAATRYIYALARARVLPVGLSQTRKGGYPERAAIVQWVFAVGVAGIFAIAGLDPITTLVPVMTGFGTLGILALQLLAALAVVVYFRRQHDPRLVSTLFAPGLGLVGLVVIVVLAFLNFPILAGSDSPLIAALPLLLVVATVGGLVLAAYLKRRRPEIYAGLLLDLESERPSVVESATAPITTTEASGSLR